MSNIKIIRENSDGGGMVYCLGIIGALVYYWGNSNTFWEVVVGLFKSLTWPAFLVYEALQRLGM